MCRKHREMVVLFALLSRQGKGKLKKDLGGAAETAHWLRALGFAEDPGSVPNTHMTAQNHLQLQFKGIKCSLLSTVGTTYIVHICICRHLYICTK